MPLIALFGQSCSSRRRCNAIFGRGDYPKWTVGRGLSPNCERVRESKAQASTHSFGPGPWHRADRGEDLLTASPLCTALRDCTVSPGPVWSSSASVIISGLQKRDACVPHPLPHTPSLGLPAGFRVLYPRRRNWEGFSCYPFPLFSHPLSIFTCGPSEIGPVRALFVPRQGKEMKFASLTSYEGPPHQSYFLTSF